MPPVDADAVMELRHRWSNAWQNLDSARKTVPSCKDVFAAYESPGRHYHNLAHIRDCLQQLDAVRNLAADANAIELAIWFHDVVYDPKSHENELRSADFARAMLDNGAAPVAMTANVVNLILATQHAAVPEDADARLVVDIDLSVLAKPPDEFDAYEHAIRREYDFVPDQAFRAGRCAILRRLLERPHLYSTEYFRNCCESAARENLRRSIDHLAT